MNSLFIDVDAPTIIFPSETRTVLSWKGNPTRLECVAEGYPAAVYSWDRAGNRQLIKDGEFGNASVLTITPSADSDFTNYTCIAKNIIGQDSAMFLLKPIRKYSCTNSTSVINRKSFPTCDSCSQPITEASLAVSG